ncbi:MAG: hypothetical protein ACKUBY_00320 [Candidatus Moraniibacteriota bacterium]|jgi:hypothetical protein
MNEFLLQQLLFISVTFGLLIIPGWFFLIAFFNKDKFATLEKLILSVPISFSIITLSVITINAFGISLTKQNLFITFISIITPLILISLFKKHAKLTSNKDIFNFSKKQTLLIVVLIVFTIISKGIFLTNTIFPTATDLGHHMFWVEKITVDAQLPTYEKIKIDPETNIFTPPEHIADFIVGEHIIFAVIKTFTNQSIVSTFPSLVLFIVNIFTILMMFILTRRFFSSYRYGAEIAILTLLFIGPLWAISGAGAKFVSGGVVGNLLGNLLIPTILYFIYRAHKDNSSMLLVPAIITITALAYTHHLSAFIFGYIFIFSVLGLAFFNRDGFTTYKKIFSLLKNPYIIPLLILAITSLLFLAPPSYLDRDAISSSIGAPSKSTRTGVPFTQLMHMLGEARFVFGLIGLLIFTTFYTLRRFGYKKLINIGKKDNPTNIYGVAFLFGWGWALLLMSLVPQLLKVNIISTRIATYGAFPLAIFSAFAIMWIINIILNEKRKTVILPQFLLLSFLFIIITFTFVSGLHDNATSLNDAPKTNKALQTFHSGEYMSEKFKENISKNNFWLVKDHNHITSDTWLKVFFADDYSFPLSRSYFKRYETNPNREICTREMISNPDSEFAITCFQNLNVHAVLVNTDEDEGQFKSNDNFYRIYQNDELSLFIKK